VNRVPQEARFSTSLCNEANELTALVNGLSHTRPEPSGLDINENAFLQDASTNNSSATESSGRSMRMK
jgi:hypothetical protein